MAVELREMSVQDLIICYLSLQSLSWEPACWTQPCCATAACHSLLSSVGSFSWLMPSAGGAGSELGALWSVMLPSAMLLEELAVPVAAV